MTPRPPRPHRWLLGAATPRDARPELLADLDDEFARRADRDGAVAARRWYRRQVRRSLVPILRRRLTVRLASGAGLIQDVKVALRALAVSPVFAVSTLVMLGLGIGAFTVVYAFVDAQVIRPLPFGDRSDRLMTVHSVHPTLTPDLDDLDDAAMSYPDLIDLREATTTFAAIEGAIGRSVAVSFGDDTRRVLAASITPGLFEMLGVMPMLGSSFREFDGAEPGFEPVVIVSHALWRDLLGGDARAVGGTVRLNDRALTVLGVMPPGFAFPEEHQLWLPYAAGSDIGRQNRSWLAIGLLRSGVTQDEAAAELRGIADRLAETHPASNRDWTVVVRSLRSHFVSIAEEGALLAAVSLLLLATCANIAGLIVARGVGRRRELGVRAALGASRARLVRWLAAESIVLMAAGTVLGLLFASWGIKALLAWIPEPPPYWAQPALDLRVAAVASVASGLVALVAGVIPALRLSRVHTAGALATGLRSAGPTASHRRLRSLLVVGQVASSFALVVGALLLARSATALLGADAGFDHSPLLSARVYIAGDRYDPIEAKVAFIDEVVARVAALPGVRGAAATGAIPTDDGGSGVRLLAPDRTASAQDEIGAQLVPVTAGFWEALGLPLAEGRAFTTAEAVDPQTTAVVVNRRLAETFWPGETAVGRSIRLVRGGEPLELRVVGVSPDLVYEEFGEVTPQSQLNVYVPYAAAGWRTQALLVNVAPPADPGTLASAVRDAVRSIDSGVAVYDVQTMLERREYNHWGQQFVGRTMTVFAFAAVLLACVGTYGVISQGVAERRREIGVRLAIGATGGDIQRLFLGTGARLAAVGAAVGLPLAVLTAKALESLLFQVSPWDGAVWVTLPIALAAAMLLASYWPARRASEMDPGSVLRIL